MAAGADVLWRAPSSVKVYRLVTTILDHEQAKALDLAKFYHQSWEIETAFDEIQTHLRSARLCLRSKTPDLVRQEFFGMMLAHFAVRGLMHKAALQADEDPDRLSFTPEGCGSTTFSLNIVRRKASGSATFPPRCQPNLIRQIIAEILEERVVSSRGKNHQRAQTRQFRLPAKTSSATTT